jgi:hypothetical protein
MTRHRMTFLFAAAVLALMASFAGAAQDPGASIFTAKPALCKAGLTPAQQAPSEFLGAPAPSPRTCFQDCLLFARACVDACNGDWECEDVCGYQFEACRCGCSSC